MNDSIDFLSRSLPLLMKGAEMTVELLLAAATLSLSLGLTFGILCCNRLRVPYLSAFLEGWTFVLRAVPFYVQLLIVYFVLPDLCGWNLSPFVAATLALGACSAGYMSQIVRCGINSIPLAQWESGFSLGYSTSESIKYLILPQMLRNVLPALVNELDSLLKSTAIASSIGMLELTRMGMNIVSREMRPLEVYLTVAGFYLCLSAVMNGVTRIIERRMNNVKC